MTFKIARMQNGFTQKEISNMLGIPIRTIENWESGARQCPHWCEQLLVEKIFSLRENQRKKAELHYEIIGTAPAFENGFDCDVIKKDGEVYILNGWNGDTYVDVCRVAEEKSSDYSYPTIFESGISATPIHHFQIIPNGEKIFELVEENSKEWNDLMAIDDYEIW